MPWRLALPNTTIPARVTGDVRKLSSCVGSHANRSVSPGPRRRGWCGAGPSRWTGPSRAELIDNLRTSPASTAAPAEGVAGPALPGVPPHAEDRADCRGGEPLDVPPAQGLAVGGGEQQDELADPSEPFRRIPPPHITFHPGILDPPWCGCREAVLPSLVRVRATPVVVPGVPDPAREPRELIADLPARTHEPERAVNGCRGNGVSHFRAAAAAFDGRDEGRVSDLEPCPERPLVSPLRRPEAGHEAARLRRDLRTPPPGDHGGFPTSARSPSPSGAEGAVSKQRRGHRSRGCASRRGGGARGRTAGWAALPPGPECLPRGTGGDRNNDYLT